MTDSLVRGTFASLDAAWPVLLEHCDANHIFLTPQWQRAWWQIFGNDFEMELLSLSDGSELIGIAPLKNNGKSLSFLGSTDVCDYMDFIVRQGSEDYFFPRLLDYLAPLAWQSIELDSLLPQSLALRFFVPAARQKGYRVEIEQMDVSPQLNLPASWEDYLVALKTKDRHELRRKLRRLEQTRAVSYYHVTDKAALLSAMASFFELFKLSHTEKAQFMTDRKREFFLAMGSSLAEKGDVSLSFLEVGGLRTSATLCFDYDNEIYLYNSAYDPTYASLSVSLLLKVYNIREAISNGKRRFDFLRGDEPYKYDLGGQAVPIYRCVITRS